MVKHSCEYIHGGKYQYANKQVKNIQFENCYSIPALNWQLNVAETSKYIIVMTIFSIMKIYKFMVTSMHPVDNITRHIFIISALYSFSDTSF